MDPDKYQRAWQADTTQTRVTIDAELLRNEVQRAERDFRAVILWGDLFELGVILLMVPLWIYLGVMTSSPWTWYLTVPVYVWFGVFRLTFRKRHSQKPSEPGEPLLQCVKDSLKQVENQIWLMRNVFWWSLLPLSVSILAAFAHSTWLKSEGWLDALSDVNVFVSLFLIAVFYFAYVSTQRVVRLQFEPQRQELLTLLTSLRDETTSEDAQDIGTAVSVSPFAENGFIRGTGVSVAPRRSAVRFAISFLGFVVLAMFVVFMTNMDPYLLTGEGFPKRSPFTGVRWQESQPEVQLGKEWFKLVSLDEIPAAEIVAFSQRTFAEQWRKRFEEDLVELLTLMEHPPQDTVTLVVQSLTSSETSVREDVPMTYANRQAIWQAAQTRASSQPKSKSMPKPERVTRPAVSIKNTELFCERVNEFLQRARVETGFSGVVVVARGGEPVYQRVIGFSHLQFKIPNSLETPFRIASLSEQFTAAAILYLEAEGKLSVDDPVHRYVPEFAAEPYRGITIYHLLTHTSGLPGKPEDATGKARWNAMSEAATPVNDYVQLACECPLKFEPGEGCEYSNFGYRVLSALIVRVTGEEYADFMEERLFKALGLRQSGVARISQPRDEGRVAEELSFVEFDRSTREPIYMISDRDKNYGTEYGSGGIFTSAVDLLQWDRILAADSFLSGEKKARLFHPVRGNYACGWRIEQSEDGRLYQTQSGAHEGHFSRMMRIPEDDLVIIALSNVRATIEIDDALEQLFRLCRSLPYQDL